MEKKEEFKIKNLEILIWLCMPAWAFYHVLSEYGISYLKENPSMSIVFFYAFFPVLFAITIKFIYDEFPISALIKAITKKQ